MAQAWSHQALVFHSPIIPHFLAEAGTSHSFKTYIGITAIKMLIISTVPTICVRFLEVRVYVLSLYHSTNVLEPNNLLSLVGTSPHIAHFRVQLSIISKMHCAHRCILGARCQWASRSVSSTYYFLLFEILSSHALTYSLIFYTVSRHALTSPDFLEPIFHWINRHVPSNYLRVPTEPLRASKCEQCENDFISIFISFLSVYFLCIASIVLSLLRLLGSTWALSHLGQLGHLSQFSEP